MKLRAFRTGDGMVNFTSGERADGIVMDSSVFRRHLRLTKLYNIKCDHEVMTCVGKDLEGDDHGLFYGTIPDTRLVRMSRSGET